MATYPGRHSEAILRLLRERLPDKTFAHVCSVTDILLDLAPHVDATPEQAAEAGLLHDLCKAFGAAELRAHAESLGLNEYLDEPNLLHGPAAAAEAEQRLGITDPDVLDAVRWHTTGRPGWSPLGLALYVADFSEPLRKHPQAAVAREKFEQEGFVAALRYVADEKTRRAREKFGASPMNEAFAEWIAQTYPA
jgi:predicted HD superfamily hydrolase involved in NAD metabolism